MYRLRIIHPNANSRLRLLPVMHGVAGVVLLVNAIAVTRSEHPSWLLAVAFLLVGLFSVLFPFLAKKFRNFASANTFTRLLQVFVSLTGSLYFLSHLQPLGALQLIIIGLGLGFIGWAEYKILQPTWLRMDENGIEVPGTFTPRQIGWNELNNVILRNDLFTIDFRTNKILQLETIDLPGKEEQEAVNAFCKSRLS
ncbi:hypothetical protein [Chitinophaga sp. Cy-1792]|uniref:hypothetical protein n=1 Tax=Chitinophaga sp. Cy-1792 TaxID=2608339 RepID=UPI001421BEED|nr:hypothetical protein [Chitinophaga sp. Cy-1792]NIG54296.1 hypothetical protein [Chitinophaga sp. Cy-1792]